MAQILPIRFQEHLQVRTLKHLKMRVSFILLCDCSENVSVCVFFLMNRRTNPFPDEYDLPLVAVVSNVSKGVSLATVGVIQLNIKYWL